jgi:hypothetical protein
MNWFPQIGAGSLAQLPLRRLRKWRAIRNELESGERILLPDMASGQIEWQLTFNDLSDAETQKLSDLFGASHGCYGAFGFVDPLANILAWSEDLSRPDWNVGLLTVTGGATDPLSTQRAWSISNGSPGSQPLMQTISVPGNYTGCFSAWVRSDAAASVTLQRDGAETAMATGPAWTRGFVTGEGASGALNSTIALIVAAGQSIQVWGLQFEAQPYSSQYKQTAFATGIYEETYFGADELKITSTGPGLSACEITLLSRV